MKKPSRRPASAAEPTLATEEWDFTSCPEEELFACLYYEYAREIEAAKADRTLFLQCFPTLGSVRELENDRDWCEALPEVRVHLRRFRHSPVVITAFVEDFPGRPWLSLPPDIRVQAMQCADWKRVEKRIEASRKRKSGPALAKFANAVFEVHSWGSTDGELVDEFRAWLKATRPVVPDYKPAGRIARPKDLLSHLGVLRKARFCEQVTGKYLSGIEVRDERNLRRARRAAEAKIATLYPGR